MKLTQDTEVTYAKVQGQVFVKNVGTYKDTLDASTEGPDRNLKMYLQDNGSLLLLTKGHRIVIAAANVSHVLLKD